MPRRIEVTAAQATKLISGLAESERVEELGWRRLVTFSKELADRLKSALKLTRVHQRNADLAVRHYLTAEALVEVLEMRKNEGRQRRSVADAYSVLTVSKVLGFQRRPAKERRAIQKAYPEVDLGLVLRALNDHVLAADFVASVLEDPVNYRGLLRKLGQTSPL